VKIQYPGAGPALLGDLKQLSRLARLFSTLTPGLDIKPLLVELEKRVAEELDYRLEAESQMTFFEAYEGDEEIRVPLVVDGTERILVTEWMEGVPLSRSSPTGPRSSGPASLLLARFLLSGPVLAGPAARRPAPRQLPAAARRAARRDRLRAVDRLPEGSPEPIGRVARLALAWRGRAGARGPARGGLRAGEIDMDAHELLDYLLPLLDPIRSPEFQFDRPWLRAQAMRLGDPRSPAAALGRS
jgi:hypothetical protein